MAVSANRLELLQIVDAVAREKSIDRSIVISAMEDAIAKAARSVQRQLQVLEARGQSPDHPVHPAIPETRYLKAYFCRVNDGLK